ncbi:unnamed protein product [Rhizophagus irregularis]|nr:unnamed protein product [Rhizophagus irregularis]
MNKLEHKICPVCNERFPSINLVLEMCHRCYGDKNEIKKFSCANNMHPGDIPEELKNLTEIEKMLIAQTFTIISVYYLRGGQYAYSGNVINFSQDIGEFVSRLPRHPSTLDTLIVCRNSAESSTSFRDFTVRHDKVRKALCWLKRNNRYYANIIIDDNVLRTLLNKGSIDDLLPQVRDAENRLHHVDYEPRVTDRLDGETDDTIIRNFIPAPFPLCSENHPNIDDTAINEFNTSGYIARAFPTLYPTGSADLRAEHVRDVKPAEYFQHLLKYKDRRFACHPRWRYFTLNSQMRWRALQEGKVYVKQSLNGSQLTVGDIQKMMKDDNHMANRIVRFGEESDEDWCKHRRQDLINNLHIATWFFDKRFETFLKTVLIPKWRLEDYWYRYEWQHRSSVHMHGIGIMRDVPLFDWDNMKDNDDEMSRILSHFDSLVTTINPCPDAPVPVRHPCQKANDELCDVVLHTVLGLKMLQGWRANVDLKPVLNIHAALQYVAKYATKSEQDPEEYI